MPKFIGIAPLLLICIAFSPLLTQAGGDDGMAAAQRGDFKTALDGWRPLAEQGFANAQHNLGVAYENGQGVPQDFRLAADWYRKAADQGFASAQNNLGVMYARGRGVPQDYRLAVDWCRKAAEHGNANAQNNLGKAYESGQGVSQDYRLAVAWYRKAADQGLGDAQNSLGEMYANGRGVTKNRVVAFALYNLSPSRSRKASQEFTQLAAEIGSKEMVAGLKLAKQLGKTGNFLKALDQYVNSE